ncbi:MAG: chemotaxis protein [[Clostridium] aminophilum]|uniref:chemotaxis protein n=1 Tax=[Clostridium] aminophilum TaxID=1526 RepID=UPI0026F2A0D3|nr:chemotaxis protein [[Clostridium] aminophilum]MDD6196659.1 chemotaxis protein [[Clostridium] aminophilum]
MAETDKYAAQKRYQQKVGIIAKSYRLKRDLTEAFARACEKKGVSQAGQLTKMMTEFIEETRQQDD